MSKPSLQEVAAMPYSEGLRAVRRYFDPNWGHAKDALETARAALTDVIDDANELSTPDLSRDEGRGL